MQPARVARIRQLLSESVASDSRPILGDFPTPSAYSITESLRRRAMVMQIRMAARNYGLQDDIDTYIAAAGVDALADLSTKQLDWLCSWLSDAMDRMTYACDHPDAPPAR